MIRLDIGAWWDFLSPMQMQSRSVEQTILAIQALDLDPIKVKLAEAGRNMARLYEQEFGELLPSPSAYCGVQAPSAYCGPQAAYCGAQGSARERPTLSQP